jgi:hypothetical protein
MTRGNKAKENSRQDKRVREQRDRQRQQEAFVQHTAGALSCATKAADEIAGVCDHLIQELSMELPYLRLALEIWNEHPELAQPLRTVLTELLEASVAYHSLLHRAGQQLQSLASDPSPHTHLEPIERYRHLVRQRLFPDSPPGA